MGIPVLIMGKSGSGKSASLRNFGEEEIVLYNVAGKPLPFRKTFKNTAQRVPYEKIRVNMMKGKFKTYIIDDSQYLMAFEAFEKANEAGYKKFTDMAKNFYDLVQTVIKYTPENVIVYFLHHTEETEYGVKAKTLGKMLDNQLTLEGLFSIVIMCVSSMGNYRFITHTDGSNTVKTPMGMFEETEIDNDLKAVDKVIREYYGLGAVNNV